MLRLLGRRRPGRAEGAPVAREESLSDELYGYLVDAIYAVPARDRRRSHWVMNGEWEFEVRKLVMPGGCPAAVPSLTTGTYDLLLGLPYEVREDGGVPHLEQD